MDLSNERMRILELIESGQITTDEGLRQLAALPDQVEPEVEALPGPVAAASGTPSESGKAPPETAGAAPGFGETVQAVSMDEGAPTAEVAHPEIVSADQRDDFERWKRYWMIPLWIGVGVAILGGLLMYWALASSGMGFWFLCAAVPFTLGVLLMVIGAQSRTARWLHLRVQQAPGDRPQRIAISFPIPIGLTAWFFRTFRHRIPGMENVPANIDQLVESLRDSTSPENPIYIHVDEDEDEGGEKVEIYIG
jgi:hypothetical protein